MGERAYKISEIDRMRSAISQREWKRGTLFNRPISDGNAHVEMLLRTYMEGNVEPDDLIAECEAGDPWDLKPKVA